MVLDVIIFLGIIRTLAIFFLGNVCGQHSSLWTLIISGLFGIFRDDLGFLGASHDISGFLGVFYGFRGGGGQAPNMKYEMTGRYWV